MDTIQYNLKDITQKLLKVIPDIKALYLFGSRRHNTRSIRSDIDILVDSESYIKAVSCREFAENICPALDLFVIQGNRAISSMNESYVEAESVQDLIQKIDAKLFWDKNSGFVKNDKTEWNFETAVGVRFPPSILPSSFLAHDIIKDYFERIEHTGLPSRPYIGDTFEDAAWYITKILKRMVLQPKDLCAKGVAKDGWTVKLSNEYDFQNLFWSVVKPWLPELAREEITITYDGQKKNADFNLFGNKIILEMKHIKDKGTKAAVVKTLAGLKDFYKAHLNAKVLIFALLVNEDVEIDIRKWHKDFSYLHTEPKVITRIIINPKNAEQS
jgi:predicted nucleotidyltransferase